MRIKLVDGPFHGRFANIDDDIALLTIEVDTHKQWPELRFRRAFAVYLELEKWLDYDGECDFESIPFKFEKLMIG